MSRVRFQHIIIIKRNWNNEVVCMVSCSVPSSGGMSNADCPFLVRVTAKDLRIRKGNGTDTAWTGKYVPPGVYTIVEVKAGKGSNAGWGRLKSGAGFISLDYVTKV